MKHIPLKIQAWGIDTGQGQYQYRFTISPLVHGSGVFVTMLYCHNEQRAGKNTLARKCIAVTLKARHHGCWQRYHAWRETQT